MPKSVMDVVALDVCPTCHAGPHIGANEPPSDVGNGEYEPRTSAAVPQQPYYGATGTGV